MSKKTNKKKTIGENFTVVASGKSNDGNDGNERNKRIGSEYHSQTSNKISK